MEPKLFIAFPVSLIESPKLKIASYGRGFSFETTFPRKPHVKVMQKRIMIFMVLFIYWK
jgi:hypothetical protein